MRVSVFRHVPFEGIGNIADWLSRRGAEIGETLLYQPHTLPDLDRTDLLVVMGGTLSANDEADFPWLRAEKACIRDAIDRGTPVLGICLGSQLMASALGAKVYRNAVAEHGWFPVEAAAVTKRAFQFPATFTAFQSHGDTFELPDGAVHLARSVACAHQAFQVGRRAIGLQFHLESNAESAGAIIEECVDEFAPGPFVQSATQLRAAPAATYDESARLMGEVLDYLTDGVT